jgi:hypothetical protein
LLIPGVESAPENEWLTNKPGKVMYYMDSMNIYINIVFTVVSKEACKSRVGLTLKNEQPTSKPWTVLYIWAQ